MKKILPIILSLLCVYANATNYYVSSVSGDDTNSGSISFPWRTASKVSAMNFVAGDVIHFAGGEPVIGVLTIHNSGTVGNPIVFTTYGTGKAFFSGLTTISSWKSIGVNLWESTNQASNLSDCNLVMVNGVNVAMGRYPNTGWLHIDSYTGKTSITSSSLNASVINWTGADVVFKPNHFTAERAPITSQSAQTIFYNTTTTESMSDGNGFFIENDLRTLDAQNEWYYNPTTKKIDIYSTTTPSGVQIATSDTLIYMVQKSNITINNFSFTGANRRAIFAASLQNLTVTNCDFNFMGLYAFWGGSNFGLSSNNLNFSNNTINNVNSYGIVLGSEYSNPYISNNSIKNCGLQVGMFKKPTATSAYPGSYGCIAASGCDGFIAEYNYLDSSGYDGMQLYGLNMMVRYNEIKHFLLNLEDGGGINVINAGGHTSAGTKLYNNIIHEGYGDNSGVVNGAVFIAHGIYLDIGLRHVEIFNNSCFNNGYSGIGIGLGDSCYVHNNYCSNNRYTQYFDGGDIGAGTHKTDSSKNNQFVAFDATQLDYVIWANTFTSALTLYSVMDSNYIARPISDSLTIRLSTNSFKTVTNYTLPMWQANTGYDLHSKRSPVTITSVGQLSILYNPTNHDSTIALSGSYIDVTGAAYSTSVTLHAYTSLTLISTGTLIIPTITYNNPANIVYGTQLSSTQLNATSNVPGSFRYVIGAATVSVGTTLNAGTYTITAYFTPSDPSTYASASKSVTLVVTQAPATLTATNTNNQTYTGAPLQPTIITNPAGLTVINTTYNGVSQIPSAANTYACLSGLNNPNYSAPTISYNFTINQKAGTFAVSNTTVQYDSASHTVSVTPSDSRITYTITGAPQRYKGSYPVTIHNTNTNFNVPDVTVTLTITAGAAPPLVWSPANMTYPAAIGAGQTNAGDIKSGTYKYTPTTGFVPSAGALQMKVDFTPSDTNLAPIIGTTRTITVSKGTDVMTASDTVQFYDGTPKPITVTTLHGGTIVITYDGTTTTPPSSIGDHTFSAVYSDPNWQATTITGTLHILSTASAIYMTNYSNLVYTGLPLSPVVNCPYSYTISFSPSTHVQVGSYQVIATINDGIHTGADTVTMTIIKATPTGTWSAISPVSYIYTVQSGILNASTATIGAWSYNVNVGDTLIPGTYNLIGTFTPTDATDYNSITLTNSITVNKGTAVINIADTIKQYNGTVQYATVITTPANLDSLVVIYTGNHRDAGSYPFTATLYSNLYSATPVSGTLIISKKNALLAWATPTAIPQGTALSGTQLDATSDIPGIFTYTPAIGVKLPTGTNGLSALFTPTDTVNYNTGTINTTISVYGNPVLNYFIKRGKLYPTNLPNQ